MTPTKRPRHRVRFEALRQISPGWARQYGGWAELWLNLPLWLRWVLGVAFIAYSGARAWVGLAWAGG